MAKEFESGIYRESEDMSLTRVRLVDAIRDAEEVIEYVRRRKQFRGRYKEKRPTRAQHHGTLRMTADLDVEPDGKLPL